jgi:hypothetical protein
MRYQILFELFQVDESDNVMEFQAIAYSNFGSKSVVHETQKLSAVETEDVITEQNLMNKDIKSRLNSGNACYHAV